MGSLTLRLMAAMMLPRSCKLSLQIATLITSAHRCTLLERNRHQILMKLQGPRLPNFLKQGQQSSHPLLMELTTSLWCSSSQEREFSSQAMCNGHMHAQHWCESCIF